MNTKQRYDLLMEVSKTIHSLSDVIEAIAMTYLDSTIVQAEVIEKESGKSVHETKIGLEDVRAVLAKLSQHGKTAEVKELIIKYGGTKLSDIEEGKYEDLLKDAEGIKID